MNFSNFTSEISGYKQKEIIVLPFHKQYHQILVFYQNSPSVPKQYSIRGYKV